MENTGNMFLMLAGIVKQDSNHDVSFFYPRYWNVLTSWADYLVASLPFPANQLCTGLWRWVERKERNEQRLYISWCLCCRRLHRPSGEQYKLGCKGYCRSAGLQLSLSTGEELRRGLGFEERIGPLTVVSSAM